MALAITITVYFVDDKSKKTSTDVKVPTGFSIAQYQEFAVGAAQVIKNCSGCEITGVSIAFGLDLSSAGLTNIANTTADIAAKGFFKLSSAVAGFFAKFNIPTFDQSNLVIAGTDTIDETDTAVAAFIAGLEGGYTITSGNMAPTDKRGNDLVDTTIAAQRFFAKSGA